MEVRLSLDKSVEENASDYFDQAKKAKSKLDGINTAIETAKKELKKIEEKEAIEDQEISDTDVQPRKKEWYENFRWFFTSSGFLVVGGRDATTNEIVIKKHVDKDDIIFHTDMSGSPFMVLKTGGKKPEDIDIEEVGQYTASFSNAWKLGLSSSEVFYVNPDQVSKEAKAGEYMSKGSFMIYGKRTFLNPLVKLAVGLVDDRIECSVPSALKTRTKELVEIVPGDTKKSDIAKKIRKLIGGDLDEIIRVIPSGKSRIAKQG